MDEETKTVLMPILVPKGKYCRRFDEDVYCDHFEISSLGCKCALGLTFHNLEYVEHVGFKKPQECLELKDAD